ncbi:unnamed protein product [Polarella glacialis]|uniref:Uncharacterized protein n=1 Tax=Polarella glacialis TaxID=89957 RepID=A0A813I545_POLGL|nr:unnamed protein product [Polarella glacialis]CAE8646126.1 unnamed protein product [Polarella glacialis]
MPAFVCSSGVSSTGRPQESTALSSSPQASHIQSTEHAQKMPSSRIETMCELSCFSDRRGVRPKTVSWCPDASTSSAAMRIAHLLRSLRSTICLAGSQPQQRSLERRHHAVQLVAHSPVTSSSELLPLPRLSKGASGPSAKTVPTKLGQVGIFSCAVHDSSRPFSKSTSRKQRHEVCCRAVQRSPVHVQPLGQSVLTALSPLTAALGGDLSVEWPTLCRTGRAFKTTPASQGTHGPLSESVRTGLRPAAKLLPACCHRAQGKESCQGSHISARVLAVVMSDDVETRRSQAGEVNSRLMSVADGCEAAGQLSYIKFCIQASARFEKFRWDFAAPYSANVPACRSSLGTSEIEESVTRIPAVGDLRPGQKNSAGGFFGNKVQEPGRPSAATPVGGTQLPHTVVRCRRRRRCKPRTASWPHDTLAGSVGETGILARCPRRVGACLDLAFRTAQPTSCVPCAGVLPGSGSSCSSKKGPASNSCAFFDASLPSAGTPQSMIPQRPGEASTLRSPSWQVPPIGTHGLRPAFQALSRGFAEKLSQDAVLKTRFQRGPLRELCVGSRENGLDAIVSPTIAVAASCSLRPPVLPCSFAEAHVKLMLATLRPLRDVLPPSQISAVTAPHGAQFTGRRGLERTPLETPGLKQSRRRFPVLGPFCRGFFQAPQNTNPRALQGSADLVPVSSSGLARCNCLARHAHALLGAARYSVGLQLQAMLQMPQPHRCFLAAIQESHNITKTVHGSSEGLELLVPPGQSQKHLAMGTLGMLESLQAECPWPTASFFQPLLLRWPLARTGSIMVPVLAHRWQELSEQQSCSPCSFGARCDSPGQQTIGTSAILVPEMIGDYSQRPAASRQEVEGTRRPAAHHARAPQTALRDLEGISSHLLCDPWQCNQIPELRRFRNMFILGLPQISDFGEGASLVWELLKLQ